MIVLELFEVGFVDVDLAGVFLGCVDIDVDVACFGVVLFKTLDFKVFALVDVRLAVLLRIVGAVCWVRKALICRSGN